MSSLPAGWTDFIAVLAGYALLALAFWGLGRMAARLLRFELERGPDEFGYIWVGLATTIMLLALVNYTLPISPGVGMLLYGGGVIYALVDLWRTRKPKITLGYAALMTVAALWLASRALLAPAGSDSGLYYFATIRWANEFPVVAGLGNLHGRLAFNQSLFVWIASLNLGPWSGRGFALANTFLCLLVMAEALRRVRYPYDIEVKHTTIYLAWAAPLLLLPPVFAILLTRHLPSAAPDVTSELLQLAIFIWYVQLLTTDESHSDRAAAIIRLVILLCALAVTIKLSNAVFAASLGGLTFVYAFRHVGRRWMHYGGTLAWAALLAVVWFGRGLLLSGCPLYPATLLCQDFPWAVGVEQARIEALWVYSWARQPGFHYQEVLGSWAWLGPWIKRMAEHGIYLLYPIALAGVGVAVGLWLWGRQDHDNRRLLAGLWSYLLTPVAVGLSAWFLTAPELRFAQGLIWLLPVAVWVPLLIAAPVQPHQKWALWGLFALVNGPLLMSLLLYSRTLEFQPWKGFAPMPSSPLVQKVTDSDLLVYLPAEGFKCWDAPLPCTPYFNPGLHLLGEGLGSGFALGPGESAAPRWEE